MGKRTGVIFDNWDLRGKTSRTNNGKGKGKVRVRGDHLPARAYHIRYGERLDRTMDVMWMCNY